MITGAPQQSGEWFKARLGHATASCIDDLSRKIKSGAYSAARERYMMDLLAARLTGQATEHFVSKYMKWGSAFEADAVTAYAFYMDTEVEECGYVPHPRIAMSGASPDRLVHADGLVEIKCPTTETHIETLLSNAIPEEYTPQLLWQMACTGRAWCDFVSFDPRMPEDHRLFIRRLERDDGRIAELETEVLKFLDELEQRLETLKGCALWRP